MIRSVYTNSMFYLVFVLLLLLALATGLYYNYSYRPMQQQKHSLIDLAYQIKQLQGIVERYREQQQVILPQQEQFQRHLIEIQKQMTDLKHGFIALTSDRHCDWPLIEAHSLLQIAGRKLWLEKDVRAAQACLNSADQILAATMSSTLLPIRHALAEDIQKLSTLTIPDSDGLALKLANLIAVLHQLPLAKTLNEANVPIVEQDRPSNVESGWFHQLLNYIKNFLKLFITVKKQTTSYPQDDITSNSSGQNRLQELSIYMILASQSIARQQYEQCQYYLKSIQAHLHNHYDGQNAAIKSLVFNIEQIREQVVIFKFPKQLTSQIMLERLMWERLLSSKKINHTLDKP